MKTKTAMTKAARTTQKAGRNAVLKAEISRLRSKETDIKKEFGPKVYALFEAGDNDGAMSLFIETKAKLQPIMEDIAKKEKEMTIEPGTVDAEEQPPPLGTI